MTSLGYTSTYVHAHFTPPSLPQKKSQKKHASFCMNKLRNIAAATAADSVLRLQFRKHIHFPPSRPFPTPLVAPRIVRQIMNEAPTSEDGNDLIFVRSLNLKATTGVDSWRRPKPQPIRLSLWLKTSVALAGSTDHLPYSIHYGTVCSAVTRLVEDSNTTFKSLEHLAEDVAALALGHEIHGGWVKVAIEKPRALLRADSAGISIVRKRGPRGEAQEEGEDRVFINDLRLVTIIGVNQCEREEKQNVVINITMHKPRYAGADDGFDRQYDFRTIAGRVAEHVEKSEYKTVEAFVTALAREACVTCGVSKVTVQAEKPSALTFAKAAGVKITRERSFFALELPEERGRGGKHEVFIALGSNLGDRYKNINDAVVEMERRGIRVKRTSSLYQSAPMYVIDQPTFLNGVCQVFFLSTFAKELNADTSHRPKQRSPPKNCSRSSNPSRSAWAV